MTGFNIDLVVDLRRIRLFAEVNLPYYGEKTMPPISDAFLLSY
jgi:hypothetical protein